jgi:hypothetical protein
MQEITDQIEKSADAVEAFEPGAATRQWVVSGRDGNDNPHERTYIQEELGFFPKQQFIVLASQFVDRFVSGDLGISMKDLFSGDLRKTVAMPTEFSPEEAANKIESNTEMIRSVIKVVQQLPDLQIEIIMLSLGVPRNERDWAREVMTGPVSRGGINDEMGFDILKTFITQNAKTLIDFFAEKGRDLVNHAQRELGLMDQEPEEEKEAKTESPSGATPGGTPSSTTPPSQASTPPSSQPGQPVASS